MSSLNVQIGDDILDTRDLEDRIEELQDEDYDLDPQEQQELDSLLEAREQIGDWQHGETLIHERYWKTYAQDFAEDCGYLPADLSWPLYAIDWDIAARDLAMDYGQIDLCGHTYYVRY